MGTRVAVAACLAVGLALCVRGGHVPLALMVVGLQTAVARELFGLVGAGGGGSGGGGSGGGGSGAGAGAASKPSTALDRRFSALDWWFYSTAAFWLYGRYLNRNVRVETARLATDGVARALLKAALRFHALLSLTGYLVGFVAFVLLLQDSDRGSYRARFRAFAWAHMVVLTTFLPSSLIVRSLFEGGIVWFLLPALLVMVNDTGAYFAGLALGRTSLTPLSPSKTVEGFVGGAVVTVLVSWWLAGWLGDVTWMTCPRTDLTIFGPLDCPRDPLYVTAVFRPGDAWRALPAAREAGALSLPAPLAAALDSVPAALDAFNFSAKPLQFHAVVLALFASLVAPFGGLFASGFKRAFGVKDFGASLPGHGGFTDRMDCQIVMALFVGAYIRVCLGGIGGATVEAVLADLASLDPRAQREVLAAASARLQGRGFGG